MVGNSIELTAFELNDARKDSTDVGKSCNPVAVTTSSIEEAKTFPSLESCLTVAIPAGVAIPPTPSRLEDKFKERCLSAIGEIFPKTNFIIGCKEDAILSVSLPFSAILIIPNQKT